MVGRYELARYSAARVNIDYHVVVAEHLYSVPHALVHQTVEIRATHRTVEVLHKGRRVAAHPRSFVRYGYTTEPAHLPAAHRAHLEWSPERLIRWGESHGTACAEVIRRILDTRLHPEHGYRRPALGLLALERRHGAARLEARPRASCARPRQRPLPHRGRHPQEPTGGLAAARRDRLVGPRACAPARPKTKYYQWILPPSEDRR